MNEVFHRPELAHDLAPRLLDPPPVSAVSSGLLLAAPRRTGKSTFLKADLLPALESAGACVLYVDLWEDIDPDDPIVPNGSNVQSALASLTRRGLVWSGDRGVYALEDARLAELMRIEGMIA